ncbi:MAG TPA: phosphatase PAP2 family protein [Stellaceae bacterium]|nr:phosphatase PAP2 family protein [Stellaceae bacterium]
MISARFTQSLLLFITDLGDAALLIPASLAVLIWFWCRGLTRIAGLYAAAILATLLLTLIAKIGFHLYDGTLAGIALRSPSGHTALAMTCYGTAALLIGIERTRATRMALLAGTFLLVTLIAASRILLLAHTIPEVALGGVIGTIATAGFAFFYWRRPSASLDWRWALPMLLAMAVLVRHWHLSVEGPVAWGAGTVKSWLGLP